MSRRLLLSTSTLLLACSPLTHAADLFTPPSIPRPTFPPATFEIKDFGATGDGTTNDTPALNKAIEKCSTSGGGTVHFPAGNYLVASVHLKNNVRLLLDSGAVITGAKTGYDAPEPNPQFDKFQDFGHSHFHNAVMWGEDLENFAIEGGTINGGGTTQSDKVPAGGGDKVLAVRTGRNISLSHVTHETGGHFVYLLNNVDNINVDHVTIKKSRDAIDLMGCRNVAVTGCHFTGCSDDTLGIKSDYALGKKFLTENVYAWDNYFESGCNGLQFGSETAGDFRNVQCWDITIGRAMKAGIGITSNDGAIIEDVHYKNISMKNAANPIFMLLTRRLRTGEPGAKVGAIRNVTIENVTATDVVAGTHHGPANAATLSGLPESYLENITLSNVKITYKGNDDKSESTVTPPYPKDYSPRSMGPRPASGLYVRHAKNLTLHNVDISFESPTNKPILVFSDTHTLHLDHVTTPPATPGAPTLRLDQCTDVQIKDSPTLPNP